MQILRLSIYLSIKTSSMEPDRRSHFIYLKPEPASPSTLLIWADKEGSRVDKSGSSVLDTRWAPDRSEEKTSR